MSVDVKLFEYILEKRIAHNTLTSYDVKRGRFSVDIYIYIGAHFFFMKFVHEDV